STLLRTLMGGVDLYAGSVAVGGRQVVPGRGGPGVGWVPQLSALESDLPLRAEDAVLLGLAASSARVPWWSRSERPAARSLLDRLGLGDHHRSPIGELSGGQQQRLLVGRALIGGAAVLVLDEPTSGLDLQTMQDILGLLEELVGE